MYDNAKFGSWIQVNAVINMINYDLYMNDFSWFKFVAFVLQAFECFNYKAKELIWLINDCWALLFTHVITSYILNWTSSNVFMYRFFVNLNGNMVVVGNKFFPLWRHFQKFHTNRCQAHLTRTGMLKYKIANNSLVIIMIIEKTDFCPEDDIYSLFP